ncbi:hypothetical protein [Archaeoglobus neptunius]|uniref:hypothetical protein n=1 Tax=Archaeoglobus neptunius TaxID=2798580 RepID=UPI001928B087|nr:hypothetical protein [Archaeoglobus neptunius]
MKIDPLNKTFGSVLELVTTIGLIVMLIPGLLSVTGENVYVDPQHMVHNWDKPSEEFWMDAKGITVYGYGWFLDHPFHFDCLSLIGVAILAFAPLLAVIASIASAPKIYKVILAIIAIELLFAIFRPLVLGGGGH